jgi:hypothetical protein
MPKQEIVESFLQLPAQGWCMGILRRNIAHKQAASQLECSQFGSKSLPNKNNGTITQHIAIYAATCRYTRCSSHAQRQPKIINTGAIDQNVQ